MAGAYSVSSLNRLAKLRLRAAADLIAAAAREISGRFSTRIPKSVKVTGGRNGVYTISAGGGRAPNAYPFEEGASHPLFGNTAYWYPMKRKPFLTEAAAVAIAVATQEYARSLDDIADALDL
jgi:hypothetical protein